MIHVSDADREKWYNGNSYKSITIIFPSLSISLDNDDIYGESMTLTEGLFDGNDELCVYGCISSIFTVEVRYKDALAGVDFKGQYISATMTASLSNQINLFHGYVYGVETVREKKYIKLTCYDRIGIYQDMDVYSAYHSAFTNNPIVTVKIMRDTICTYLGITQETQTLANDSVQITEDEGLTELAAINILRAICQINGVFGIINRDGKLEYRKISVWAGAEPYPSNDLFPSDDLYPGDYTGDSHEYIDVYKSLGYQDYDVEPIDRVVVRDSANDSEAGGASATLPYTNALLVEGNMFAEGMTSVQKAAIAQNILDEVSYLVYKPFDGVNRGLPYVEVGDSVSYYSALDQTLMTFSILKRELKGVQWLEDRYTASGTQYQPEVKYEQASNSSDVAEVKEDVKEIKEDISDLESNKQNFIDLDILEPTWDRPEGDIILNSRAIVIDAQDHRSGYQYVMWRRTNNAWEKMQVAQYSQIDLQAGVSDLPTGEIYLVYE
jgi:hypothetical protein